MTLLFSAFTFNFQRKILFLVISTLLVQNVFAQNLDNLGGPLATFNGNITIGTSIYETIGRDNRRSPFSYYISANPTLSIYGFDIPINLTYRDQQGTISNPFNRFSISPKYKWASVQVGKFSKTISKYSLSGQLMTGVGVDLNPGKFKFSAAYGTLQNDLLSLDTLIAGVNDLPIYKRDAFGVKIGVGGSRNYIDLSVFKAKDDINSVDPSLVDSLQMNPEDNLILGTAFGFSPVKWMVFKADVSSSLYTATQFPSDIVTNDDLSAFNDRFGNIMTINHSSSLQFAGDASLRLKFKAFSIGGEYRRIDPNYKTLGGFYFQEDSENFMLSLRFSLAKGKIRFNGRGGLQRNNLNNLRRNTSTRQIINAGLSIAPSKKFSISGRYSNFQTERRPGLVELNDTIRVARATESINVAPRFSFGSKDRKSDVILSLNFQNLEDLIKEEADQKDIENYVASLTYRLNMKPTESSWSTSLTYNNNIIGANSRTRAGLNVRWVKGLLDKKLKVTAGVGGFLNYLDNVEEGQSFTGKVGGRYTVNDRWRLSMNLNYLNRTGINGFQEIRANLRGTYRMSEISTRKSKSKSLK